MILQGHLSGGRKAGAPFLGGWVMVSHRFRHVFSREVLLTLWVGLYIRACGGGCPVPLCLVTSHPS